MAVDKTRLLKSLDHIIARLNFYAYGPFRTLDRLDIILLDDYIPCPIFLIVSAQQQLQNTHQKQITYFFFPAHLFLFSPPCTKSSKI